MKNKKLSYKILKFCSAGEVLINMLDDFAKIASDIKQSN